MLLHQLVFFLTLLSLCGSWNTIAFVSMGHLLINYVGGEEETQGIKTKQFRDTIGN